MKYLIICSCLPLYALQTCGTGLSFVFSLSCRGGAELLKKEGNLEVPSWQILVTKPQFVLLSCIAESWADSMTKAGKVASVPKAVIDSVFYLVGKQSMVLTAQLLVHTCTHTLYIPLFTYTVLYLGE